MGQLLWPSKILSKNLPQGNECTATTMVQRLQWWEEGGDLRRGGNGLGDALGHAALSPPVVVGGVGKEEGAGAFFFSLPPNTTLSGSAHQGLIPDSPDGIPDVYLIGDGNMGSSNGNMGSRDGNKGSRRSPPTGIWVPAATDLDTVVSRDAPCHFP